MTLRAHNPNQTAADPSEITPTQLFGTFSQERRQFALAYLAQKPAAIPLGDLAEYIALTEGHPTREWYERVLTDLCHRHLPHLCDAGLVHFDEDTERVELAVNRAVVDPYLELAHPSGER